MATTYSGRPTFEIGRVIERTFGAVGHNFLPFLAVAALFAGLPQLVLAAARYAMVGEDVGRMFTTNSWVLGLAGGFFTMAGAAIMQAAIMQGTIADLNGEKVSVGAMARTGLRYMLPMIGIVILSWIAIFVGAVFLIVPGLIVAVMFSVAAPSEVVERTGVFGAFSRSRDLTRNHRWMIFFLLLIFWVVAAVFQGIVFGVFTGVIIASGGGAMLARAMLSPVVATLQGLIAASGVAAIYYELRSIKEGIAPDSLLKVFD